MLRHQLHDRCNSDALYTFGDPTISHYSIGRSRSLAEAETKTAGQKYSIYLYAVIGRRNHSRSHHLMSLFLLVLVHLWTSV